MSNPIPSCFNCTTSISTSTTTSISTSLYTTPLGPLSLTWSTTSLALSFDSENLTLRIRPFLFFSRHGTRTFHLKNHPHFRSLELTWDLRRAQFRNSPQPTSGFYVTVSGNGNTILAAGDLAGEKKSPNSILVLRREHVIIDRVYATTAKFGGREREIGIEIGARDEEEEQRMSVRIDGECVLEVCRIRWKFRGTKKAEVEGGRMLISWDLHNWLFSSIPIEDGGGRDLAGDGQAVFMFRFEREEGHFGNNCGSDGVDKEGQFGNFVGRERKGRRDVGRVRNGSFSSWSTISSGSSGSCSTVAEWASQEEMELEEVEGFTLVVYASKRAS